MNKYISGVIGGVLFAIAANFTAPITFIEFLISLFIGISRLFGTMILCVVAFIVFTLLVQWIPIVTSRMWENILWTWEEINAMENSEESDLEE